MIKIIAAPVQDEPIVPPKALPKQPLSKQTIPTSMPASESIPLADDDPEDQMPGQQSTPTTFEPHPDFPADEWQEITPGEPPAQMEAPTPEVEQPQAPEALPEAAPEEEQPFPEEEFEEITEELSELDNLNATLSISQKLDKSLAEGYPLRIIYTTLKGHTTERTVRPDYYLPARTTGNWVLIAWCELRQDWRGFIVNRIRAAKLEPKDE